MAVTMSYTNQIKKMEEQQALKIKKAVIKHLVPHVPADIMMLAKDNLQFLLEKDFGMKLTLEEVESKFKEPLQLLAASFLTATLGNLSLLDSVKPVWIESKQKNGTNDPNERREGEAF